MKPLFATWQDTMNHGHAGCAAGAAPPSAGVGAWWNALLEPIAAWHRRSRGRSELRRLDARLLRDIGLTEEQAGRELVKPFWRA